MHPTLSCRYQLVGVYGVRGMTYCIEYSLGNSKTRLDLVGVRQLEKTLIRRAGHSGQIIESLQIIWREEGVAVDQPTPIIPGQHFAPAQRRYIARQVHGDEPQSAFVGDSKILWPSAAGSAKRPRLTCCKKLAGPLVKRIELKPQHATLQRIDLKVGADPSTSFEHLGYPVVNALATFEIHAKATPRPCRNTLGAKRSHGQDGKVPAAAKSSKCRFTANIEGRGR